MASTLLWWAFAFVPLPRDPPAWLTAARYACFGPMTAGWPAADAWILLILAPASFLVTLGVLWGRELTRSLRHLSATWAGRGLLGAVLLAFLVEATWVVATLRTAWAVATWEAGSPAATPLPRDYPRQTATAPDFVLIDQHGDRVSLAQLYGQPVVLTFVFAHCQAMCPVIVASLKRVAPDITPGRVLMITLDPWRDTPSVLPALARQWALPANVHLLSSRSTDEVLSVVRAYGVPFERSETSGDIVHPGLVYLIDARGQLTYAFNNPSPTWVREGLRRLGGADGPTG